MENASKALIMAGSILISLMVIGALLLMFNNLSNYQKTGTQDTREAQVIAFNNQYETYNRKNVRGSDLYSLLSRVIDYNRRKSTQGTGEDSGKELAYQPMTITVYIGNENIKKFYASESFRYQHLIEKPEYIQSGGTGAKNEFQKEIDSKKENAERNLRRRKKCTKFMYCYEQNLHESTSIDSRRKDRSNCKL